MPPKQQASKKTTEKVKAKIVEDKTFGLKNKKGAKQQKFIEQVQKQVTNKVQARSNAVDPNAEREKKKEEEKRKKEEIAQLFKPVVQTVARGVDPKSVVCVYYKQGICQKGDKCKFSHDLTLERKSEKRNIYEDTRSADTMEGWDEEKLEDVVNQKHGEDNKIKTQIVCKYFIEAVENKTYGWFWNCPNGNTCMYRHALPPGFTLKSEMKKKNEEDEISLEMLIEKERASLGSNVTKVTLESFLAWKQRKLHEKRDDQKKKEERKLKDYKLGFMNGLTGRDLFTFNPDLIVNDDDDAQNDIDYRRREGDDDEEGAGFVAREVNFDYLATQAREADNTGTVATDDRFSYMEGMIQIEQEKQRLKKIAREEAEAANNSDKENQDDEEGEENDQENDEDGDDDGEDEQKLEEENKKSLKKLLEPATNAKKAPNGPSNKLEIDESLFNLEDLADIEGELENLDI